MPVYFIWFFTLAGICSWIWIPVGKAPTSKFVPPKMLNGTAAILSMQCTGFTLSNYWVNSSNIPRFHGSGLPVCQTCTSLCLTDPGSRRMPPLMTVCSEPDPGTVGEDFTVRVPALRIHPKHDFLSSVLDVALRIELYPFLRSGSVYSSARLPLFFRNEMSGQFKSQSWTGISCPCF